MRKYLLPILLLVTLSLPACSFFSASEAKLRCLQMAKTACFAANAIPAVGQTVASICDLYITSETVTKACEAAGNKVSSFLAPFGDWLKKHGLIPKAAAPTAVTVPAPVAAAPAPAVVPLK